jgi:hypothetical protein
MTLLLETLYKKKVDSKEILKLIAEQNQLENNFKLLATNVAIILSSNNDQLITLKERAIKLYITILTGQDQFDENALSEHLVKNNIFGAFLQVSIRNRFKYKNNLYIIILNY